MQKWEYIYVSMSSNNAEKVAQELSELGEEGWEAGGISEMETHDGGFGVSVLLKRPC